MHSTKRHLRELEAITAGAIARPRLVVGPRIELAERKDPTRTEDRRCSGSHLFVRFAINQFPVTPPSTFIHFSMCSFSWKKGSIDGTLQGAKRGKRTRLETTMTTTTTDIASWIATLLPSSSLTRGFVNSSLAVLLTIVLELASYPHVQKLLALKGGRELYRSAIWTNVRNNLLLGPLTYYWTIEHVCSTQPPTGAPPLSIVDRIISVAGILIIEGALYYYLHKCFHEVKSLYWIHRYAIMTLAFWIQGKKRKEACFSPLSPQKFTQVSSQIQHSRVAQFRKCRIRGRICLCLHDSHCHWSRRNAGG
jgi:hypothetical protein